MRTNLDRCVCYYRVSTKRQENSALGLEAQEMAIAGYLRGSGAKVVAEFQEAESGRKTDDERPELAKALAMCRLHQATLIIARLDRLARNVAFVSQLMRSSVAFVAVDFPEANKLTIHILAAVAEHQRDTISENTKSALAAAKARGVVLGNSKNFNDKGRAKGRAKGHVTHRARAIQRAVDVMPTIRELMARGPMTLRGLADALNAKKIPATRGGIWHPATVRSALAWAGEALMLGRT